ncbi:hypothetical protein ACFPN7_04150 [Amycolatopsis halotolerans]|uniref:hypothetical protein n=1 Tax=Amycolatopsis halotolerans TaxID=330083 RepID=UPI00360ED7D9
MDFLVAAGSASDLRPIGGRRAARRVSSEPVRPVLRGPIGARAAASFRVKRAAA